MFRSASVSRAGNEDGHAFLRAHTVRFVEGNPSLLTESMSADGAAAHLRQMKVLGNWAGEIDVLMLALALNVEIHVVSVAMFDETKKRLIKLVYNEGEGLPVVILFFNGENHYDAVTVEVALKREGSDEGKKGWNTLLGEFVHHLRFLTHLLPVIPFQGDPRLALERLYGTDLDDSDNDNVDENGHAEHENENNNNDVRVRLTLFCRLCLSLIGASLTGLVLGLWRVLWMCSLFGDVSHTFLFLVSVVVSPG